MFEKILNWIRKVWSKMIKTSDVKSALKVDVAISPLMVNALQLWANMYSNLSPWLNKDVKSLNLAASISGEIARAVTIELKVEVSGGPRAEFLEGQIAPVLTKLREWVEFGEAKGGLMLKPYPSGKGLAVDAVQADQFYPVAFDSNGHITACVFSDQRLVGNKYYTRLEFHTLTPAGYEIRNEAFVSDTKDAVGSSVELGAVPAWAELLPQATITGVDRPLFAYFRVPGANNVDVTSPLGVSCFSRAVELIEQADKQWSNFLWEFESGQRALYADVMAFGRDDDGKPILPMKRLYRALNGGGNLDDNPEGLFHDWSPDLRETNILNGLDAILRKIEFLCGLAYGTISNPATVDKTATEMKISQQRSFATIADTQKALQSTLEQLLYAMDVWATLNNLAPAGAYQSAFDFDDSIIVDKEAQMSQDRQTVGMQAMPKYIFLMRNYGLSEEDARKWIAEYGDENPPVEVFPGQGV